MGLEIRQTYAKIGVDRTPARFDMEVDKGGFEIEQRPPQLNIESDRPFIEIDQSDCFANAGFMSPERLTDDAVQRGYQQVLSYIAKVAQDGDRLAAIQMGGDPIADIAQRDAFPVREFGNDRTGMVVPKITAKKWSIRIDHGIVNDVGITNGVSMKYTPAVVDINYTPAKLQMYLRQKNSININYTPDKKIDTYV